MLLIFVNAQSSGVCPLAAHQEPIYWHSAGLEGHICERVCAHTPPNKNTQNFHLTSFGAPVPRDGKCPVTPRLPGAKGLGLAHSCPLLYTAGLALVPGEDDN